MEVMTANLSVCSLFPVYIVMVQIKFFALPTVLAL